MKKTIVLILVLAVMLPLALCSCSSKEKTIEDIKASGKLTIATCSGFEPFEVLGTDGKVTGVDIDIAQAVADYLGVTLEIADIDFDSIVGGIQSGKYDLGVAGMSNNAKRRENVNFSSDYYTASQSIIVPVGSAIASAADLEGKTIGVQAGTTGETYCQENSIKFQSYPNGADACVALVGGKIDAVVIDNMPAKSHVAENDGKLKLLDEPLTKENYAIAIKKENAGLLEAVNTVLKQLTDNGKLYEIFDKYDLEYDK